MNMNDIIEDYLLGNLSAEEKQTFEKELAINADLQKEVELHRILITEVQAFNAVQDAEAAYRAEQEQNSSAKVIVWNFKRIASIAACLLIVIGGYNVWLHQYTIGVGEDAYSVIRGSGEVVTLMESKQCDAALQALDQNLAMNDDIELHEYLLLEKAVIYLLQGERIQAKNILEGLTTPQASEEAHKLLDKLHWYSPITNFFNK